MMRIQEVFPGASDVRELRLDPNSRSPQELKVRRISSETTLLGYHIESQVVSRSGPFRIQVLLDTRCHIKQATVISYPWTHGRGVLKPAFTDQFIGKGPQDPVELGNDIEAITGATISSRVMTNGIRDIVNQLKQTDQLPSPTQVSGQHN